MTKKIVYSFPGLLRRIQMGRANLIIFLEGPTDRYYYSKIAEGETQGGRIIPLILTAEEISTKSGGKQVLIDFFRYLETKSALNSNLKGKITTTIFYMDKDVDEFIKGKKIVSDHIVYTKTYELENYFFIHGKLDEATAVSSSLDIQSIRDGLGDINDWRAKVARLWMDWVKLCLFAHVQGNCPPYYSRPYSQINNGKDGGVKKECYEAELSSLQKHSRLNPTDFNKYFLEISKKVDTIFSEGHYDEVFKGSWYCFFIINDVKKIAGRKHYIRKDLYNRIISNLITTINFNDSWVEYFKIPLRKIVQTAGI
jgi:hypothetical protein